MLHSKRGVEGEPEKSVIVNNKNLIVFRRPEELFGDVKMQDPDTRLRGQLVEEKDAFPRQVRGGATRVREIDFTAVAVFDSGSQQSVLHDRVFDGLA